MSVFSSAYTDTVTVEKVTGVDAYGQPAYSAPRPLRCKFKKAVGRVLVDGILVDAAHVFRCSDKEISVLDRVTLAGGQSFIPKGVTQSTGLTGETVVEVVL